MCKAASINCNYAHIKLWFTPPAFLAIYYGQLMEGDFPELFGHIRAELPHIRRISNHKCSQNRIESRYNTSGDII